MRQKGRRALSSPGRSGEFLPLRLPVRETEAGGLRTRRPGPRPARRAPPASRPPLPPAAAGLRKCVWARPPRGRSAGGGGQCCQARPGPRVSARPARPAPPPPPESQVSAARPAPRAPPGVPLLRAAGPRGALGPAAQAGAPGGRDRGATPASRPRSDPRQLAGWGVCGAPDWNPKPRAGRDGAGVGGTEARTQSRKTYQGVYMAPSLWRKPHPSTWSAAL